MIKRDFYRFGEVAELLHTDSETLRQAVALGKVPVFVECDREAARWFSGDDKEARREDPYCTWRIDRSKTRLDDEGYPVTALDAPPCCTLSGWFRVGETYARRAAQAGDFAPGILIGPSFVEPDFAPWNLWFSLANGMRPFAECAWFLASDLEKLSQPDALKATKWPWGEHETDLLRHLAAAAKEHWSGYDPAKPTTAPKNSTVIDWLVRERHVSERIAKVIATILRADDLKDGPRPRR